jgi:hypothetical protein
MSSHLGYDPIQRKHPYVTRCSNWHARIEMRIYSVSEFAFVLHDCLQVGQSVYLRTAWQPEMVE